MKHADLIARLEKLTGPDREVDAAVWCQSTDGRRLRLIHDGAVLFEDAIGGFWVRSSIPLKSAKLPRFTASLDDAVALVERMLPGWHWNAQQRRDTAIAFINNGETHFVGIAASPNPAKRWFEVRHATPAIALLIATLRALQESDHDR